MFIKQITITKENIWDIIHDDEVYVLKSYITRDGFYVAKIKECDIKDILAGNDIVFRIIKD